MKLKYLIIFVFICSCGSLDQVALDSERFANKEDLESIKILNEIAPSSLSTSERAKIVLSKMSFEQKCEMIGGNGMGMKPFKSLGLREIVFADAAQGLRTYRGATAYPSGLSMAATWNRSLAHCLGNAIGKESLLFGIDYLLGPGINLYRLPTCGRNFEYLGEDPHLAGKLAAEYVRGLQSNRVGGVVKHFAVNNQEYDRHNLSSDLDEDVMQMFYFPAFKKVLDESGCAAVMMAYNPVNGVSASENKYLIKDVLRTQWGFDGIVMSDWGSTYNALGMMKADLDLEMPSGMYYNFSNMKSLLDQGKIEIEEIDSKVLRILETNFRLGIYDRARNSRKPLYNNEILSNNREIARQIATEGLVLLKNEKLLPLESSGDGYIVLVGPNAKNTETGGGGASYVVPVKKIDILKGIKKYSDKKVIYLNLKNNIIEQKHHSIIKGADAVLVCAGLNSKIEMEGLERYWELPEKRRHDLQTDNLLNQETLIKDIANLNRNTCVILTIGGGVKLEPWINNVAAVIHSFYGGQEIGTAVGRVIFGLDNPSGKLPFSMAKKWEDFEASKFYIEDDNIVKWRLWCYPYCDPQRLKIKSLVYGERFGVGYRNFVKNGIKPLYAFGYGLSYTTFNLTDCQIKASAGGDIEVTVSVVNTGVRSGAEVVQVYVQSPTHQSLSPLDLRGFDKVFLEAGEAQRVSFLIKKDDLKIFDSNSRSWKFIPGNYSVRVGTSSDSFAFTEDFKL
ncbi:MAG: glycoside hydrolase family 3 C-terminal domain-containing protein [Spirochaetales bacterium]|nr:glycoside hydrolase family 3 C-terminal domain-containing protein [Spirochaetales bacterium]